MEVTVMMLVSSKIVLKIVTMTKTSLIRDRDRDQAIYEYLLCPLSPLLYTDARFTTTRSYGKGSKTKTA